MLPAINSMIDESPATWQELQEAVAQILNECGVSANTNVPIETVRGSVNVDVLAIDKAQTPPTTTIVECKLWKTKVPKTVVHSLRTVVDDYGANWGWIVSAEGFQSGAVEAAKKSNIRLYDWHEFQEQYVRRWMEMYFCSGLHANMSTARLIRLCCEPFGGYPVWLPFGKQDEYLALERKHTELARLAEPYYMVPITGKLDKRELTMLPSSSQKDPSAPRELLEAKTLRSFFEAMIDCTENAMKEFDSLRE